MMEGGRPSEASELGGYKYSTVAFRIGLSLCGLSLLCSLLFSSLLFFHHSPTPSQLQPQPLFVSLPFLTVTNNKSWKQSFNKINKIK
ncbi:hypothetical protein VNO77_22366 [Canavalia gladiata]|uniref:Uncharacterized protein n=1 Tax=Canavalia gladiata TaxID=3824 RepID=A0AAN9QEE3_CANGL